MLITITIFTKKNKIMYYTSTIIQDIEEYNAKVNEGENYNGTTNKWSAVIKHKNEALYAILAHEKYPSNLDTLQSLDGWFNTEIV